MQAFVGCQAKFKRDMLRITKPMKLDLLLLFMLKIIFMSSKFVSFRGLAPKFRGHHLDPLKAHRCTECCVFKPLMVQIGQAMWHCAYTQAFPTAGNLGNFI